MAVLGRLLVSSAERLDLPDFLSLDSYITGDFKYLMKSFVGDDKPFVLKGFDVINPNNAIGTQNISIRVADSIVYYPGSTAGPYFHGLSEGNLLSAPLVPELRKNATNYVYLTLTTVDAAKDTRAFWDPDKEAGAGGEFTQDVNTQTVLTATINVSVSSFPDNTIPVCKVVVGANFITSIQDARDMMFRLGSGGLNPNPLSRYAWREESSSTYARKEPNTTMSSALDANPFQGGDKNIQSLKEWMDAIMTKLAELGGTTYWYENTSVFNLINVFKDALATSIKSKGTWAASDSTPGLLIWSEDLIIQSTTDQRDTIIRAGSKQLANDDVMYIERVRNAPINTGSVEVTWFNGTNYVNGQLGAFENLSKGDFIKKADDSDSLYLRVEEFYAANNLAGGVTSPSNALSIKLSANYAGTSESKQASYSKGIYLTSDVVVANRADPAIEALGGNYYWLALRSDTIMSIANIVSSTVTMDITDSNDKTSKCTSVAHGLQDGQRITIDGSTNYDGTYAVEVESVDVFYIQTPGGPFADETGVNGYYATVTTQSRSTANGIVLESANHEFRVDQKIIISGTTNYNSDIQVFPLGNTTFSMPIAAPAVTETAGLATAVEIYVRTDVGPTRLDRGESKGVGDITTENLMSFIGMENDVQTYPIYSNPLSYNTLWGQENFNADPTDNLTQRVSKLTTMMADKAQDKTVKYAENYTSVNNTTNGSYQDITFIASGTPTLNVILPSSTNFSNLITLTNTLSLATNQVAYFIINRNSGFSVANLGSLFITSLNLLPLDENVYVFAYRLTSTDVYLYNNKRLKLGGNPVNAGSGLTKVRLYDPVDLTLPTGAVTIDGITVANGDRVLFSALTANPNRIYSAIVSLGLVTGWTAEYDFGGFQDPIDGDLVVTQEGILFADQIIKFDGTNFVCNDKVRYFNGTDYWEQSSLFTSTISDNQFSASDVTTYNFAGSQNSIVKYSIVRGTSRETGMFMVTTDGITVGHTNFGSNIGSTGVSLTADISGSLLRIRYTSTNIGVSGTIKFSIDRWSDIAGGPSGIPSYSGSGGVGSVTSSGTPIVGELAFFTNSTDITSASFLKVNTSQQSIDLNGLLIGALQGPYTLINNTITPTTIFTYDQNLYPFSVIEYSIERGISRKIGTLLVTHDNTNATVSDVNASAGTPGVTFSTILSGGNVNIQYVTTNIGLNATMKFSIRKWA